MRSGPTIHYYKRQDIDIARWDACVARSANRLLYGFHFYLDQMTGGDWDALVLEDYQAVMPLTWRRKYGITYLAQPAFTQQTGVFSPQPLSTSILLAFLQETARRYRFAEIFLNYDNPLSGAPTHTNFVLSLDKPYPQLSAAYTKNLRRNLRNAEDHNLRYTADIPRTEALDAYRRQYRHRNHKTKEEDYRRFDALCASLEKEDRLLLRVARDKTGELLAIAALLRDESRLYLLQSTLLAAGREHSASHFLVDQVIREFAGQPVLLDFEGSDDPGVGRFYAGFGSVDQPYFFWRLNNLPWPLRLLKSPSLKALRPK